MATTKSGVPALRVGFIGGGAVGLYIGAHLVRIHPSQNSPPDPEMPVLELPLPLPAWLWR